MPVTRPDHGAHPSRVENRALESFRCVVVVSGKDRRCSSPDGLRAPREIRGRRPHGEKARLEVAATCERTHMLVGRKQLRHVLPERPHRLGVRRAGGDAVLEEPRLVARPVTLEEVGPAFSGLELLDRLEPQHYSILNENGSGSRTGTASTPSLGTVENCRLIPSIQAQARSVSSWSSVCRRPRVTRIPMSAPG